jgi:hypothetical protein
VRRESSTVVVLVGEVADELIAGLAPFPNVSVARASAVITDEPGANGQAAARPGWEPGAAAMRTAARRGSTYVVVLDDPLASVAAAWRGMWDLAAGQPGAAAFEEQAADALAAWRAKQFELPDYYLVVAGLSGTGPDFYLGPLRAVRPRRVAFSGIADGPVQAARLVDTLRSLDHGPWWPPLDELLDAARHFYAGGLAESQQAAN